MHLRPVPGASPTAPKRLAAIASDEAAGMRHSNQALQQAPARHPNMRIYDWAAAAEPGWFIPDGIHYTSSATRLTPT